METIVCPHCPTRVVVTSSGQGPSCRLGVNDPPGTVADFAPSSANPYAPPRASTDVPRESLTTAEMCYSAAVILWSLVLLAGLAVFHFVLIPGTKDPGIFYFIVAIYWTFVVSLSITVAMNLAHRSLLVVPTVVQCGVLVFSVYA